VWQRFIVCFVGTHKAKQETKTKSRKAAVEVWHVTRL